MTIPAGRQTNTVPVPANIVPRAGPTVPRRPSEWLVNVVIYTLHKLLRFLPHSWHEERARAWALLACALYIRYDLLGGIGDLKEAIVLGRVAFLQYPPGHPILSWTLNNLSVYLVSRYKRIG